MVENIPTVKLILKRNDKVAKIYKAEIYVLDINDAYYPDEIFEEMERYTELIAIPFNVQSRDIEWHDDIDINKHGCTKEQYMAYFNET